MNDETTKERRFRNMKYFYSIMGRVNEATSTKDGEIQFFLNRIKINHDKNEKIKTLEFHDSDDYINSLITYLNAVELHELGHIFNWKDGCKHGKNLKKEPCLWCEETYSIYFYLLSKRRNK